VGRAENISNILNSLGYPWLVPTEIFSMHPFNVFAGMLFLLHLLHCDIEQSASKRNRLLIDLRLASMQSFLTLTTE
jgi:hypothetical protein